MTGDVASCGPMDATRPAARLQRPLRIAAWAALVLFTVIVCTGAAVRLTGSGLGCHNWPKCTSDSLLPETAGHATIEFGNRMITTPVAIAALICLLLAHLRRPRRRDLVLLGALLVAGVVVQAVVGGLSVLAGLSWGWVTAHFVISMVTLVVCVMLVWRVVWERRGGPPPIPARPLARAATGLAVAGGVVVLLGALVTSAGPYAGGAGTGDDRVPRLLVFGFDTFPTMVMIHARVALVFGLACVALWAWARLRGDRVLQAPLTALCVLVALAGLVGQLQYHVFDYPAALVWAHVAVVTLTWTVCAWLLVAAGALGGAGAPADANPRSPVVGSTDQSEPNPQPA